MIINVKNVSQSALYALMASGIIVSLLFTAFFLAEPAVSYGNDTATFSVHQTITDETSFLVNPTNVNMTGSINGISGGNATGTTSFVVISNNATGYYVDIAFFNNGTTEAMIGNINADEAIRDYGGDTGGEPSYTFAASTSAQLAYTVSSNTTSDTDQSFKSNGTTACNTGTTSAGGINCWKSPATTAFRIVNRANAAVSGATTTIQFKINVPSGATPVPTAQAYTATATLSLFAQ